MPELPQHAQATVRVAQADDADAIGRVRVAAWQAAYSGIMPADFLARLNPAQHLDRLQTALECQDHDFFARVACQGTQISGFALAGKPRIQDLPGVMELRALNVAPDHWRQGHGSRLMAAILQTAAGYGYSSVLLWCVVANMRARQFYEAQGFIATGTQRINRDLAGCPFDEMAYRRDV